MSIDLTRKLQRVRTRKGKKKQRETNNLKKKQRKPIGRERINRPKKTKTTLNCRHHHCIHHRKKTIVAYSHLESAKVSPPSLLLLFFSFFSHLYFAWKLLFKMHFNEHIAIHAWTLFTYAFNFIFILFYFCWHCNSIIIIS